MTLLTRTRSIVVLACLLSVSASAKTGEPYRVHALVNARIWVTPSRLVVPGTILIRDGVITAVGENLALPADAQIWNLAGKTVHAGFIDAYLPVERLATASKGSSAGSSDGNGSDNSNSEAARGAGHALASVTPQHEVAADLRFERDAVASYRAAGFVTAQVVPTAGIFRGSSAVVALGDDTPNRQLLLDRRAMVVAFATSDDTYPDSLMGVIAAIRQGLQDGRWYQEVHAAYAGRPTGRQRPAFDLALAALAPVVDGTMPVVFDIGEDPLSLLRAARIGREYGLKSQLLASGAEHHWLDAIVGLGLPLIVPVSFPPAPGADSDDEWVLVPTERLEDWQRAPSNPALLAARGVEFALTPHRLAKPAEFAGKVREALAHGLEPTTALAALTTVPARLLGLERTLGTLEPGKIASFVVRTGDPFAEDSRIDEVWIDGRRYPAEDGAKEESATVGPSAWLLQLEGATPDQIVLDLDKAGSGLAGTAFDPHTGVTAELCCVAVHGSVVSLEIEAPNELFQAAVTGIVDFAMDVPVGELTLTATSTAATSTDAATRHRVSGERIDHTAKAPPPRLPPPTPAGGPLASPSAVLVRDATLWTAAAPGRLEDTDLLIVGGRIQAIGRDLSPPAGAFVIDGAGKHVTPGLIDAHSHTAIRGGVNEGTRAVTAEVRIGDVVDAEDRDIYFQLAGGLTVANLLHGSANPIGGQNQVIKLRWGSTPDGLLFEGATPGIKFALGENVKQSNWGDKYRTRYPQTRLGVEQVMRERFLAAQDYMRRWSTYRSEHRTDPHALPPRTDLQLETIAEILRGERLVHCHSYRQDEILMLLRLAAEFEITIGTFQHILEGYKVADELAAQGAGASTFSDWWAYKFEVYDAIPYNGALMWDRGVIVSFNSDSNDLARRLNTEATKAIRFGGMPEEEALKLVTLNPARQLRIADRVGSLEVGKDGDFVVWDGPPLATTSVAEQTWIEGRQYFDRARDLAARAAIESSRKQVIGRAKAAKTDESGGDGKRAASKGGAR